MDIASERMEIPSLTSGEHSGNGSAIAYVLLSNWLRARFNRYDGGSENVLGGTFAGPLRIPALELFEY